MYTCVISVVTVYSIEYHKTDYTTVRMNYITGKLTILYCSMINLLVSMQRHQR